MSLSDPQLAMRFGYGLSPQFSAPRGASGWIDALYGPDPGLQYQTPETGSAMQAMDSFVRANRALREDASEANTIARRDASRGVMGAVFDERRRMLLRATHTQVSLHDRLTEFWQDHFTVRIAPVRLRAFVPLFTENAIRPHVAGRFADMLKAVVTHPAMLLYLDQATAVGPSSDAGKRTRRGLNENLAREVLELHTLGVGGPYSQDDVRQLAELFTGLRADFGGFSFRPHLAEPGAEIVLGRSYGSGGRAQLDDVLAALEDLAAHPATAAHIARKLAVHFTSDTPDAGLIADLSDTFTRTGGDLAAMIGVLIDHPATHASFGEKARRPLEFVLGGMRALAPDQARLEGLSNTNLRDLFDLPLEAMGQPHRKALGPDGWAETAEAWITPQGLAARISWAMVAPSEIRRDLPDPRIFVDTSLGPLASAETRFAARAAETRWEGVGLILSAPEFHRR